MQAAVRCRRLARIAVSHLTEQLSPLHDELAVAPVRFGCEECAVLTFGWCYSDRTIYITVGCGGRT